MTSQDDTTNTDCCGGTGIGCACGITPVVQICDEEEVAAASRAFGLAVVNPDDRDGLHDPRCGGCQGQETSETCRYSVKQRRAYEEFSRREVRHG
jgi:hypothetical protein